jgi:membrane-bound metal-dependent hydrolase YbcI (DUF457 family)
MNPITHFLAGWAVGLPAALSRRDRGLIVLASISPDLDAAPALIDLAKGRSLQDLELGSRFHHSAHTLVFAAAFSLACLLIARRRFVTAALAFAAINLHYLCDIAGSRGPDGYHWPIPYLMPFSPSWQLSVPWQWGLNAWPNVLITAALLALTIYFAWRRGCSPAGLLSTRADQVFTDTLRNRFGMPADSRPR